MTTLRMSVAGGTSMGRVRESNEDLFTVTNDLQGVDGPLPRGSYLNPPNGTLLVVADGVGGANAGEIAASLGVEGILQYFRLLPAGAIGEMQATWLLTDAIRDAHEGLLRYSLRYPETEGMGTTLVLCWILGEEAHIAWSGDSRCYHYRFYNGLQRLTRDHSYVQFLVDLGMLKEEETSRHPQGNIILQCLGYDPEGPRPDTLTLPVKKGDYLLLCSDGLTGMLSDKRIRKILRTHRGSPEKCMELLIEAANEAGGLDNITVVLAKLG
jgi:serine/threonine protein phosphatase PrpC